MHQAAASLPNSAKMPHDVFRHVDVQWQPSEPMLQRTAVVFTAFLSCFFAAGLTFGFSALMPSLLDDGVFHEDCFHKEHRTCHAQRLHLVWVFTLGASASALSTLPQGILLDWLGPRTCGLIFNATVAAGCVLFSMGGPGLWQTAYTTGFVLIAVGGSGVFVSTISFGNLFPGHAGLILAMLVACFDASMVIFELLALLISSGMAVRTTMRLYALLPAALAVCASLVWPRANAPGEQERQTSGSEDSKSDLDFWGKVLSADFFLFVYAAVVDVLSVNYFVATVFPRLLSVRHSDAKMLNSAFAFLLPAGAFVYAPLIGFILGHYGPAAGFLVFSGAYVIMVHVLMIFELGMLGGNFCVWVAFALFALCRPLLYASANVLCGDLFSHRRHGQMYGLVMTLGGFCSLCIRPLAGLAASDSYVKVDYGLLVLQVFSTALPLRVLWNASTLAPSKGEYSPFSQRDPLSEKEA